MSLDWTATCSLATLTRPFSLFLPLHILCFLETSSKFLPTGSLPWRLSLYAPSLLKSALRRNWMWFGCDLIWLHFQNLKWFNKFQMAQLNNFEHCQRSTGIFHFFVVRTECCPNAVFTFVFSSTVQWRWSGVLEVNKQQKLSWNLNNNSSKRRFYSREEVTPASQQEGREVKSDLGPYCVDFTSA